MAVHHRATLPTQSGSSGRATECAKDGGKPVVAKGMPGAGLSGTTTGKAPPERPALKPYWGKPAVRNFRGARGNGATASAKRARSWKRRTRPSANLKGHRASRLLDRPERLLARESVGGPKTKAQARRRSRHSSAGANKWRARGTAKRRQRSAAGRTFRSRSTS